MRATTPKAFPKRDPRLPALLSTEFNRILNLGDGELERPSATPNIPPAAIPPKYALPTLKKSFSKYPRP
eukprot:CAMPEP_0182482626 /NCGR_PEP_ID=MMETSP1319-20130603/39648_1 /TAXON_ID=172717 /ORGANISM="Bolidomonas pacifica, Strain RCC208" /LENGTH=68 /DNA_ID=CAMNT_0024684351 /DNA_START=152 /DNA_END=358 /DNA_ORIENTATION=-